MAELRWGLATHEGNVRPQNEDNAFADGRLFVVADGMGGHLAGEVASEMVVTRLHDTFASDPANVTGASVADTQRSGNDGGTSSDPRLGRDDLVAAVAEANTEIFDESSANPDRAGMGTTVTAIVVVTDAIRGSDHGADEVFAVANVGDSRIYRVRHERLRQVTIDHSFVQELVAEGAITREEARTHPRRNIVTRALGIESDVRVDSWTLPIVRGDRFVLCSDGLVDEVADDDITAILVANPDPQDAAERCVEAALLNGGRDNVTVVVIDVVDGLDPPDPTEEIDVIAAWDDGHDETPTGEVPIIAAVPAGAVDDSAAGEELQPAITDSGDVPAATDITPSGGTASSSATTPATMSRVAAAQAAAAAAAAQPQRRRVGPARFLLMVGVAAVLILGAVVFTAWARSGYTIAFNDSDRVALYQGKDVLWFQQTEVGPYPERRDQLTDTAVELVEDRPTFSSRASANSWAKENLQTTTTTTTTTTTSTTTPSSDAETPQETSSPIDGATSGPPPNTTTPATTITPTGP